MEKQQKLRNFIDRWPIEAYFNSWTNHKGAFFRHCQRKNQNIKVYEPSKSNIKHPSSVPQNPDSANPYDAEAVRQPCLKCGEAPTLVSPFLNQLVQKDGIRKGELAKLGIRSDFDVDTILLLGPNEFDQLLRPTSMTNFEKASLKNSLRALKPSMHVREGVTETDLRDYLAKVYTCEQHCVFPLHMHVPRQILKLFNELHMEYLIPAVILLGVNSDANLQRASYFDDATLEDMIYEQSTHVCLSPLQKVALKWVLQKAS
ncbi:hypothetical protein DFJ43DRAFT_320628 [Lentinula guzmanii]|uniref:Uncharacterized protein n=1 Tax=Lentinula guzmanii TaxID=2804957 RepID=A0AA38JHP2_9AGAR|nr:hypothetical protein DFJ43DRAFT_320628 [Lentinula guzmanii]